MSPSRTSMRLRAALAVVIPALVVIISGCAQGSAGERDELLVFAAASLADAMNELETTFEEQHGPVAVSYGASQSLAQQIASGAPADVYIAAGQAPMEFLAQRDRLEGSPVNILRNRLVVVVQESAGTAIQSLEGLATPEIERIAVADPDLAPAGQYAREALQSAGLWEAIQPKLIIGSDVRATLAYVETGNADAALVYRTDAMLTDNVKALDVVPPGSYSPIRYPAAVVERSERKDRAREFLEFLQSDTARAILDRYGFDSI